MDRLKVILIVIIGVLIKPTLSYCMVSGIPFEGFFITFYPINELEESYLLEIESLNGEKWLLPDITQHMEFFPIRIGDIYYDVEMVTKKGRLNQKDYLSDLYILDFWESDIPGRLKISDTYNKILHNMTLAPIFFSKSKPET